METERDSDFEDCVVNTHIKCRKVSMITENDGKTSDNKVIPDRIGDSFDDISPYNLKLDKGACNEETDNNFSEKVKEIESVLSEREIDLSELKALAISKGGLVKDELRKIGWPQLLELKKLKLPNFPSQEELEKHPVYQQVVLDVNRSLKRFPPTMPTDQRLALQNELTFLILQVISTHPRLCYYQGYHDIAVTLLLVTGKETAYCLLEKLSTYHLKDCMEPTMEKTSYLLNYIFPLIRYQDEKVYDHLERSGVGTIFALPWFLTWFGHNINQYEDVVRLYDYFLANEPLMPLYFSAAIVAFRSKEILATPCDMANLHCLLSQIPEDLPFEKLLLKATELYQNCPPKHVEKEVKKYSRKEQEKRNRDLVLRRQMAVQNLPLLWRFIGNFDPERRLPIWAIRRIRYIPEQFTRYPYWVATAVVAVGIYWNLCFLQEQL